MGDMSAEPSMEEILSSIKRIIAEEGEAPTRGRRAPRAVAPPVAAPAPASYFEDDDDDDGEVLELSDPMPAVDAEPFAETAIHPDPVEEAETVPQPHVEPQVATLRPATAATRPAPQPVAPASDESIVSDHTAEASRHSLDNLTRLMARPEPVAEKADDNSLEGLVRSMLRPMLREWLDTNLPAMVEEMVASEIARITSQPR